MRLARILFLFALLLSPSFAFAAPQTFSDLAQVLVGLLDGAAALLVTLGIVIYFWGIVSNTIKTGEKRSGKIARVPRVGRPRAFRPGQHLGYPQSSPRHTLRKFAALPPRLPPRRGRNSKRSRLFNELCAARNYFKAYPSRRSRSHFPPLRPRRSSPKTVDLLNIFAGLLLTAALLTYGLGFVMWITRLGSWPSYRTEGIKVIEWSTAILFVLVVMLMITNFFRDHSSLATYITAAIVVFIVLAVIISIATAPSEEKKPAKAPPRH